MADLALDRLKAIPSRPWPGGYSGASDYCYKLQVHDDPKTQVGQICYGALSRDHTNVEWLGFHIRSRLTDNDKRFMNWVARESVWADLVFNQHIDGDNDFLMKHGFLFR